MTTADMFKEFERAEGRPVLVELRSQIWVCGREQTPTGPVVGPAMRLSATAIEAAEEALKREREEEGHGTPLTQEDIEKRLREMSEAGAPVQEPVQSSILMGTIRVERGLVFVTYDSPGGKVTTAIVPEEIKCVSYVDEGLIERADGRL